MGQRMKQPPAERKPSAEAEETPDALNARVRELAQDAWTAYLRDPTEKSLQRAELLSAIGYTPDRRRKLAQHERRLAGEEAGTDPQPPDLFWRKVWLKFVRPLVRNANGDHGAVARDLIVLVPATLRVKCPDYPTSEAEFKHAVAKVLAARYFQPELNMYWAGGQLDERKLARAVLRALGMSKDESKNVLRPGQWHE
jgi:hypothetical protein